MLSQILKFENFLWFFILTAQLLVAFFLQAQEVRFPIPGPVFWVLFSYLAAECVIGWVFGRELHGGLRQLTQLLLQLPFLLLLVLVSIPVSFVCFRFAVWAAALWELLVLILALLFNSDAGQGSSN
ncbi:MAG: hypothetical protein K2X27_07275 [Candidatus Obscuribacterales bacterium]|nr:hypothetical protein [Candidatus Obscuribacterales bacterium]